MIWKDMTNIKGGTRPVTHWMCEVKGTMKVHVYQERETFGEEWLLTCNALAIQKVMIDYGDVENSMREALIFVRTRLENKAKEYMEFVDAIGDDYKLNVCPLGAEPQGWAKVPDAKMQHYVRYDGTTLCYRHRGLSYLEKEVREPNPETDCKTCSEKYRQKEKIYGKSYK